MFVVTCGTCRQRRLVSDRNIRALQNLAPGVIAVRVDCHCGGSAVLLTGGGREPVQVTRSGVGSA